MASWITSSFCVPNGCVEVSFAEPDVVQVRESSDINTVMRVPNRDWEIFLRGIRAGKFDRQADVFLVRESSDPNTVMRVPDHDWEIFLRGVRAGEFDRPTERRNA